LKLKEVLKVFDFTSFALVTRLDLSTIHFGYKGIISLINVIHKFKFGLCEG